LETIDDRGAFLKQLAIVAVTLFEFNSRIPLVRSAISLAKCPFNATRLFSGGRRALEQALLAIALRSFPNPATHEC